MKPTPVAVFFAFANDRVERARYLRNLPEEQRQVREAMETAEAADLCEIVERPNATVEEVLDVFQDPDYRDRVAVFHFGGHAGDAELLLESANGEATVAHAGGLARFLGQQRGLELVFLNGCSSRGQVQGLLDAGVPAVIATSQAIDDGVATEFSARFYRALASGAPVPTAYAEAEGAVQTRRGDMVREAYRSFVPDVVAEDRWPWDLYVAPGAEERLARWSLPLAARDPLFGLPALPAMDLPLSPFKHLAWFGREDAHVFFGRGREIRDLYEAVSAPDTAPIVLLFGATGVGKSSLLAAGLAPRLEATHEVIYLRRDGALGCAGTLAQIFEDKGACVDLGAAWRAREETTGKPLVVILDQAEEAWTQPLAVGNEAEELAATLRVIFAVRESRPRGRLILSFRKEWLAEVLRLVDDNGLPRFRVEVTHLDRDAIAEAIAGPASTERLRRQYRLEVDPKLPDIIADDLLEDPGAAIAPALQILLTKMWAQATEKSSGAPRFTVEFYQRLKRDGILLDDFVSEQLESLRQWRPELVGSGLALDLLGHHTTALGTAEKREAAEIAERYGGRPEVTELLRQCQDRYLLFVSEGTMRLSHDTLAPLVRRRFETSNLPGQRALRILQQRAVEWAGGKEGPPLDEVDLAFVEQGRLGMRALSADEERLVTRSQKERVRRRRQRRISRWVAVLVFFIIVVAAGMIWKSEEEAEKKAKELEESAEEARTAGLVSDFLADMFLLNGEQLDEMPQILDRGRKRIETDLAGENGAQDELRETIGVAYHRLGLFNQAEELFQKVVDFRRNAKGPEHPNSLLAANNLAIVFRDQGRLKEAEGLHRQTVHVRRRVLGEEHPDTLASMNDLAGVYESQGRFKEAEDLYSQTLESRRTVLGEEHPDTLASMNNLANVYGAQGRLREAEDLHRQTLEINRRVSGEEHPDTLLSMNNLADVYRTQGRLREAEDLFHQTFALLRRVLGEEHPHTLVSMNNLADVYQVQGRLNEAEGLGLQAYEIRRRVLGDEHPDTLTSMNTVAVLREAQGRFKEAEDLNRRTLEIRRRVLGDEHPDTLLSMNNLANAYEKQDRDKESEDLHRQTLEIRRRVLGENHPDTLWSMNNLAVVYQSQGHLKAAEDLQQRTLEIRRRVLGESHPDTLWSMRNLAIVYQAQGRLEEANALADRALAILRGERDGE